MGLSIEMIRSGSVGLINRIGDLALGDFSSPITRAAAEVLIAIHDDKAVPHLIRLLGARNPAHQLAGAKGLSRYVHQSRGLDTAEANFPFRDEQTQSHDWPKHKEDESTFVDYWKQWWTSNQSRVQSAIPIQ